MSKNYAEIFMTSTEEDDEAKYAKPCTIPAPAYRD
jgi:hypothetical protein